MKLLDGRRLVIAYNPNSTGALSVKKAVFDRLDQAGYHYETIEVKQAPLADNVARLALLIQPNDTILSAAGDGSAHAIFHSVLMANQPGVQLGFLAFGNFNDVPHTFTSLKNSLRDPVAFLEHATPETVWPLNISIDDKPLRNALLYVTVGWTAQAAARFDDPKIRQNLTKGGGGLLKSLWRLGWYYLKTRHTSGLPTFRYMGKSYQKTDLMFANGPVVARLFRTGKTYYKQNNFLYRALNVRSVVKNIPFFITSLLGHMKGEAVSEVMIDFDAPFTGFIQCDGEVVTLNSVGRIEVKKATESLMILATH